MSSHWASSITIGWFGDTTHLVQYCCTTLDEWFDAFTEFVFEEEDPAGFSPIKSIGVGM